MGSIKQFIVHRNCVCSINEVKETLFLTDYSRWLEFHELIKIQTPKVNDWLSTLVGFKWLFGTILLGIIYNIQPICSVPSWFVNNFAIFLNRICRFTSKWLWHELVLNWVLTRHRYSNIQDVSRNWKCNALPAIIKPLCYK